MAADDELRSPSPPAIPDLLAAAMNRLKKKQRMMKNLESATRSRARKQAHLALMEAEVVELRAANTQLRIQYDQLLKATLEAPVSVKKTLHRVLSATF